MTGWLVGSTHSCYNPEIEEKGGEAIGHRSGSSRRKGKKKTLYNRELQRVFSRFVINF